MDEQTKAAIKAAMGTEEAVPEKEDPTTETVSDKKKVFFSGYIVLPVSANVGEEDDQDEVLEEAAEDKFGKDVKPMIEAIGATDVEVEEVE
jgi:hypothetical protein